MSKLIGIDLGTTNSCMAFLENGRAVLIPSSEGRRTTPSVVAFTRSGERLVGEAAKRQAVTNAERTFSSVKREMGSDRIYQVDGKKYRPQELSAMILQKLKADAESISGRRWRTLLLRYLLIFRMHRGRPPRMPEPSQA